MPSVVIDHRWFDAVLFDMDGVVTDSATLHATCWKTMFDEFLGKRGAESSEPLRYFDADTDYKRFVDGKPRYEGVRDFLQSRHIILPEGTPEDPPTSQTVCGLGNRKNELINQRLASIGVKAFEGTVAFLEFLRRSKVKTAIVTSSQNCRAVLEQANLEQLFDVCIDGDVLMEEGLAGKPAPDSFLKAAELLGVAPERAVVIEDAISGVRAAALGGFGLVIGVARNRNPEELKARGADIVVDDVAELLP